MAYIYGGGAEYDDYGISIAVDGSGNVYVTGESDASWGSPVNPYAGGYYDAFAAKLDSNGVLQWNTFMGSTLEDESKDITVDGSGDVYVVGYSGAWGSPVDEHAGWDDVAAKLDNNGVRLWHTFMGSSDDDEASGVAVDGNGNVYISGVGKVTWGSPVNSFTGDELEDAFAAKLNSSGTRIWNTFMGGESWDNAKGIAVDGNKVYVTGNTYVYEWGTPISPHAGWNYDVFVVKMDYSEITNVERESGLPAGFELSQNYPNPFSDLTSIKYELPRADHVALKIYNIQGQKVKTLVNQFQPHGIYTIEFDAGQLSGGIYLYELNIGNRVAKIKKMTVIK